MVVQVQLKKLFVYIRLRIFTWVFSYIECYIFSLYFSSNHGKISKDKRYLKFLRIFHISAFDVWNCWPQHSGMRLTFWRPRSCHPRLCWEVELCLRRIEFSRLGWVLCLIYFEATNLSYFCSAFHHLKFNLDYDPGLAFNSRTLRLTLHGLNKT